MNIVGLLQELAKTTVDPSVRNAANFYAENLFTEQQFSQDVFSRLREELNYCKSDFNDTPDREQDTQALIEKIYYLVLAQNKMNNER